jgi:cell division protein FtsB
MTFNKLFTFVCGVLVIINVTFFIKGIKLAEEINYYEQELKVLHEQNTEFEQDIYALESLSKTASLAAELKFDKYNDPIFTDMPQYALK